MNQLRAIVSKNKRHLKWESLDFLEMILMAISGLSIFGFTATVFFDVVTRLIGHPWLWLQEVTIGFFVYGVFLGGAVVVRRNEHLYLSAITESMKGKKRLVFETINRLVVLAVAICFIYFGYENFLLGFGSYMMPSMTPIAVLYVVIPISGLLIVLFTVEQLVNGWRRGFDEKDQVNTEKTLEEVAVSS